MKYLLDTHTLIWSISGSQNLSPAASAVLRNVDTHICVSTVSFWEIAIKSAIGKLKLSGYSVKDIPRYCNDFGFITLPIFPPEALLCAELPVFKQHKDPFDRLLIATALLHGYTLISKDSMLQHYESLGLQHIW